MKKLLSILSIVLWCASAHADTFTAPNISADATAAGINQSFSRVADILNGNVEGSTNGTSVTNIKADSVYEINMADDANPRVRDSELFNITVDTVSGGSLTQGAVVESGCVPADDTDLTSDISACVAYVNGYRVSKSATSTTYTASRDNYVDLSQTGVYTVSAVTNGATQPAVAANSVRLAKVVTDGTEITTITTLFTTRVPGLIVPSHYRTGLYVSRDSTTTVTVLPGSTEINNSMVSKTATTTLTISTAGDWAGGSSLRAADTFGFVGMDSSGNIKLHTTAPTHDNYAVSTTAGKKRYVTWSSTVYRALGWFYMDGNGSGNVEVAGNIKEGDVANGVISTDANTLSTSSNASVRAQRVRFYSSGGPIQVHFNSDFDGNGGADRIEYSLSADNSTITGSRRLAKIEAGSADEMPIVTSGRTVVSQATHNFETYVSAHPTTNSDVRVFEKSLIVEEV